MSTNAQEELTEALNEALEPELRDGTDEVAAHLLTVARIEQPMEDGEVVVLAVTVHGIGPGWKERTANPESNTAARFATAIALRRLAADLVKS